MRKIIAIFLLICVSFVSSCNCVVLLEIHIYMEDSSTDSLLTDVDLTRLIISSNMSTYTLEDSPHQPRAIQDENGDYFITLYDSIGVAHTDYGIKRVMKSFHEKLPQYWFDISDPVGKIYKQYNGYGREIQANYVKMEEYLPHVVRIKYHIKLERMDQN